MGMADETREQMMTALAEDLPGEDMRVSLAAMPLSELRRLRQRQLAALADIDRRGQLATQWDVTPLA